MTRMRFAVVITVFAKAAAAQTPHTQQHGRSPA